MQSLRFSGIEVNLHQGQVKNIRLTQNNPGKITVNSRQIGSSDAVVELEKRLEESSGYNGFLAERIKKILALETDTMQSRGDEFAAIVRQDTFEQRLTTLNFLKPAQIDAIRALNAEFTEWLTIIRMDMAKIFSDMDNQIQVNTAGNQSKERALQDLYSHRSEVADFIIQKGKLSNADLPKLNRQKNKELILTA